MPAVLPVKKRLAIPGVDAPDLDAQVQNAAMKNLATGLEGPSKGLSASIGQGRSAVAQFAKDSQRQAATQAVKTGAVGQGTEAGLVQGTRQSVMGALAKNEANNAQLISDEQKGYMDKALDIGMKNKELKQNQGQFDVTAGQEGQKIANQASQFQTSAGQDQQKINNQAAQFATTANQTQQQIDAQKTQFGQTMAAQKDELTQKMGLENTKLLADLGGAIPTVATKVMDGLLGKTGQPLTPSDKADLSKWYDDQKAKGAKMDAQMDKLIENMVNEAVNPQKSAMTQLADTEAANQLTSQTLQTKLSSGQPLSADEMQAGVKANAFPQFTAATLPVGSGNVNNFLKTNPNAVVNIGGTPYKVVGGSSPRTGHGTFSNQARHTDVTEIQDAQGNTKYVYNGKINDKMPKTVGKTNIIGL